MGEMPGCYCKGSDGFDGICGDERCCVPNVQVLFSFLIAVVAEGNDIQILVRQAVLLNEHSNRRSIDTALPEAHIGVLAAESLPVSKPVTNARFV